jgi:hypothetical protein
VASATAAACRAAARTNEPVIAPEAMKEEQGMGKTFTGPAIPNRQVKFACEPKSVKGMIGVLLPPLHLFLYRLVNAYTPAQVPS